MGRKWIKKLHSMKLVNAIDKLIEKFNFHLGWFDMNSLRYSIFMNIFFIEDASAQHENHPDGSYSLNSQYHKSVNAVVSFN